MHTDTGRIRMERRQVDQAEIRNQRGSRMNRRDYGNPTRLPSVIGVIHKEVPKVLSLI